MIDFPQRDVPDLSLSKLASAFADMHCDSIEMARKNARVEDDGSCQVALLSDPIAAYNSPEALFAGNTRYYPDRPGWHLYVASDHYRYRELPYQGTRVLYIPNVAISETVATAIANIKPKITSVIEMPINYSPFFLRDDVFVEQVETKVMKNLSSRGFTEMRLTLLF